MGRLSNLKWIAVVGLVGYLAYHYTGGGSGPRVGAEAPGFTVPLLSGGEFSLADHAGKVIILDFWATWCPPCKASLPALERVYRAHQDDPRLYIASVNTDRGPGEAVARFVSQRRYTFPVLLDQGMRVSQTYNVQSIPTLVLVGPDGRVSAVQVGLPAQTVDGIAKHLEDWIAEALPADP